MGRSIARPNAVAFEAMIEGSNPSAPAKEIQ